MMWETVVTMMGEGNAEKKVPAASPVGRDVCNFSNDLWPVKEKQQQRQRQRIPDRLSSYEQTGIELKSITANFISTRCLPCDLHHTFTVFNAFGPFTYINTYTHTCVYIKNNLSCDVTNCMTFITIGQ